VKRKRGNLIVPGGEGDPRKQAAKNPYTADAESGLTPYIKPALYSPNARHTARAAFKKHAQTGVGGGMGGAGSAADGGVQSVAQSPLYYDYRWSTPDKYYFPKNRVVANSIWREIYKRDAAIGIATDMYAELPWSDFDIVGIEDSSIKKFYEDMFNEINVVSHLMDFTRDFLVQGELVLHALFNSSKGYWERIIPHNPDYIRAEGVGLAMEQPLLWLRPTPEIKRLINSPDPRIRKLQQVLPKELINAVRMNREIPLDSLNTTFIPRLNSSTDIRGTSIYTRLYRTVMYEDFVVNASLAIAQRHAAPLRIFKLGDPATGWLPDEDDEAAFAEMLSMAEADPLAAIVMHHNVSVELVGVTDRVLLISREWDFIERIKLLAMGVAKSFLVGETSFAAALAGLQTLLERLASLRMKFERDWIIKKLCKPLAEMHGFYKRPQSELEHRIRVKTPDEMDLILPTLKWQKGLEPTQDTAILGIWRDLKERGMLSDRTYASGAGVDLDVERRNQEAERDWVKEHPELFPGVEEAAPAGGKPGPKGKPPAATPGAPMPPPVPLPGASASIKKTGSEIESEEAWYNDVEDKILELADMEDKIDVSAALEIIKGIESSNNEEAKVPNKEKEQIEKRLSDATKHVPLANKTLLSGS
jgi:hypothetical protein